LYVYTIREKISSEVLKSRRRETSRGLIGLTLTTYKIRLHEGKCAIFKRQELKRKVD